MEFKIGQQIRVSSKSPIERHRGRGERAVVVKVRGLDSGTIDIKFLDEDLGATTYHSSWLRALSPLEQLAECAEGGDE